MPLPNLEIITAVIRERHLEQIKNLEIVANPIEKLPLSATFDDLVQWTNDSMTQINKGIAKGIYGGPIGSPINFNNAFMAFMESAAMYLRDVTKIVDAVETYRSNNGRKEDALKLLEESTEKIDTLAKMWGMRFIQICDLVERHPDGHSFLVGPFCGAFVPIKFIDGVPPFIGVAFKGTSVTWEVINDLTAISTTRVPDRLWNSQVSEGFYYPLFSTYDRGQISLPYLLIQQAIQDITSAVPTNAIVHVTGHSLGGAYSSLCYAQLCIDGFGPSNATLGDLYNFGSPRVGRGDFAQPFKIAVTPPADIGSTWRIVNHRDYVPEVPASPPWPISRDPFIHIDAAYKIYADGNPEVLPSELGTHPTWAFPTSISAHYTTEYYRSLWYATAQQPPPHPPIALGNYPLTSIKLNTSPIDTSLPLRDVVQPEISLDMNRNLVVGTIKFGSFVGEFSALLVGALEKLDSNPSFRYNVESSWKYLYAKENLCICEKGTDGKSLVIHFIVEKREVALATVSTTSGRNIGNVDITRGSCVWVFGETEKVARVENELSQVASRVFD